MDRNSQDGNAPPCPSDSPPSKTSASPTDALAVRQAPIGGPCSRESDLDAQLQLLASGGVCQICGVLWSIAAQGAPCDGVSTPANPKVSGRRFDAAPDEVEALVNERRLETAYKSALTNSVALGELELTPAEVRQHARLLFGTHIALRVLLKAGESRAVLEDIATQALANLEPAE